MVCVSVSMIYTTWGKFGLCFCIVCGVVYIDKIEFKFTLRPLQDGQIGGCAVSMKAKADDPSFCKGMVYAAAYTKESMIKENISTYYASGFKVSLADWVW